MWEVPLETQQQENVANTMLAQTTKPELSQHIPNTLFVLTTASLHQGNQTIFTQDLVSPHRAVNK